MDLKEIRKQVEESPHRDWFLNLQASFLIPFSGVNEAFTGFVAVCEYVDRQYEGWVKLERVPQRLDYSKRYFREMKDLLGQYRDMYVLSQNPDSNPAKHKWRDIDNRLNIDRKSEVFTSDSEDVSFFMSIHEVNPEALDGAMDYIGPNGIRVSNPIQPSYMQGIMMAYEFRSARQSVLPETRKKEKRSIAQMKSQFNTYLNEAEQHLSEYTKRNKESFEEKAGEADELVKEKTEQTNDWFGQVQGRFKEFIDGAEQKYSDLRKLYEEHLQLEAPAMHWHTRAKELRKIGNRWLLALVLVSGLGVSILYKLLTAFSDEEVTKIFEAPGPAVRFSVILITLISFLAYLIRTFTKLTFSSFHLVRDAEEREKLAYVYLSLLEKQAIEKEERSLVLQSLFSRADSGLLKDDSSPTMPGNIIDKFVNRG
ncbi:DUF6161 domain-containing protein [Owenweeksia hongkongensis]|uniref:DUF6161 domain-containing protein n=1 Tax=Owenweeksia hongkongensis TaxID=253245 RepID=UPI003A94514E